MEDDFSLTEILVVIMPYENSTVYTKNSFIDIGCLSVNELTAHNSRNDLRRILELQVACKDKSELLQCIKLLEQRSDIYSAEPNYILLQNHIRGYRYQASIIAANVGPYIHTFLLKNGI